jgi:probable phosphoglycerate mutase
MIQGAEQRAYVGQLQCRLSEEGVRQALRLRVLFEHFSLSAVYASDLWRSMETASIIADGAVAGIQVHPELREISLGAWEGRSFAEIKRRFPRDYKARGEDLEHWRPPGGESFGDCRARAVPFIQQVMKKASGDVLVVGHAGVNRLILCEALGIPLANMFRIQQDYGCLNVISFDGERTNVRLVNYTPWGVASPATQRKPALDLDLILAG